MTQFILPMPPSVNSIWRGKNKGVYRSAEYVKWISDATILVYSQRVVSVFPPYKVTYEFSKPITKKGKQSKVRMDLANREKALSDLLQKCNVITDDCEIIDMCLRWVEDLKPNHVRISIQTIGDT